MANTFALGGVLVLLAVVLNGCGGCDQAAVDKCTAPYMETTKTMDFTKICPALTAWTGCLKDASCCDDDGAKAAIAGAIQSYNTVNPALGVALCKDSNKATNKCA